MERESLRALKNYILSAMAKGCVKQQINYLLKKAGWGSTYIENAFREILEESFQDAIEKSGGRIERVYANMHGRMLNIGYTKEEAGQAVDMLCGKE